MKKQNELTVLSKENIVKGIKEELRWNFRVDLEDATPGQVYRALCDVIK